MNLLYLILAGGCFQNSILIFSGIELFFLVALLWGCIFDLCRKQSWFQHNVAITSEQGLHWAKAFSAPHPNPLVIRLGHKLRKAAEPNCPKGYPIHYGITLSHKILEKSKYVRTVTARHQLANSKKLKGFFSSLFPSLTLFFLMWGYILFGVFLFGWLFWFEFLFLLLLLWWWWWCFFTDRLSLS